MAGRRLNRSALLALLALPMLFIACVGAGAPVVDEAMNRDGYRAEADQLRARAPGDFSADDTAGRGTPGADAGAPTAADDALIIRTGSLGLEATDVPAAVARARDLVATLGGYVSASEQIDQGGRLVAMITYRVPATKWNEALEGLRRLGDRLVHEATQAEEVTSQVVDLRARITNLRASEAALLEIMERAGSIEDVLAVQLRLEGVREQIELLVARQQDLEGRAALATLIVTWEKPLVAVTQASSGWNLNNVIDEAAAQTVSAGQGLVSAIVWLLVVGVPVFGPMLLIGLLVVLVLRRSLAGRPAAPGLTPPAES